MKVMYMYVRNAVMHIVVSPLLYMSNKQSEITRCASKLRGMLLMYGA